jgi:hypothetical protein
MSQLSPNEKMQLLSEDIECDVPANTLTILSRLNIGNSSPNVSIYQTDLALNGYKVMYLSGTDTVILNSESIQISSVIAQGSKGNTGQILTSNGSASYWADTPTVTYRYVDQTFTGDGTNTTFAVPGGYTPNELNVFLNGIRMGRTEVNITSGTNIIFTNAPENGMTIDINGYLFLT